MTIGEAFKQLQIEEAKKAAAAGPLAHQAVSRGWYRAWLYHEKSPEIFEAFCKFTKEAVDAGWDHYGSMDIIGRIRWHTQIEQKDREFKIVNAMHPYYARVWLVLNPQHDGFFRTQNKPLMGMA